MCPFLFLFFIYSIFHLITNVCSSLIKIDSNVNKIKLKENQVKNLSFTIIADLNNKDIKKNIDFSKYDKNIIKLTKNDFDFDSYELSRNHIIFNKTIKIEGKSVGHTYLEIQYKVLNTSNNKLTTSSYSKPIQIVVSLNENEKLTRLFFIFVAILVSLNTINMGCAVDTSIIIDTLRKPIAPMIGFFTHYFFMPVFAYLIGKFLLYDEPWLRLSLFIFGCSPGGTASNMWTVLLQGNLNLTITMTFLSTLFAIFMMPLWLFTLGISIYDQTMLEIPYRNIFVSLITMVVCIGIGLVIQKKSIRFTRIARRILAPVSGILILFIVLLAIYCYWYIFKLMTWKIILSSALNVWFGFLIGMMCAALFKQNIEDIISISIETGIQNTGITYILIKLSLDSPYRDFALTVPIAASIMTSFPLAVAYLFIKLKKKSVDSDKNSLNQKINENKLSFTRKV